MNSDDESFFYVIGSMLLMILVVAVVVGCLYSTYGMGYNAGIQDVMSGKVKPVAATTQWVVDPSGER